MRKIFSFLFYSFGIYASFTNITNVTFVTNVTTNPKEDLLLAMKKELSSFETTMPPNPSHLVTNIITTHSYGVETVTSIALQHVLNEWELPNDVKIQMDMAAYSFSEQFQTYSFSISTTTDDAYYEQYILSAKHIDENITIAFIHAQVSATLVQQWEIVHVHTCHKCYLFFHCCSDATNKIKRGNTPSEVETIMNIVQSTVYNTLVEFFPIQEFLYY